MDTGMLMMEAPPLLWGTTKPNRRAYLGRVHIVRQHDRRTGWCGLPVDAVWPQRPPARHEMAAICPECAITYLTTVYPIGQRSTAVNHVAST
jgi:hypothetical protein